MLDDGLIERAVSGARGVLVNDYEMTLLTHKTGHDAATWGQRLAQDGGALIVTRGAQGCDIWTDQGLAKVGVAKAAAVVDPTGCGDAFRAGLLYGLARHWNWASSAQMGAAMAAIQIAHEGAQTYSTSETDVLALKARAFGA